MINWNQILQLGTVSKKYGTAAPKGLTYKKGSHGGTDIVLKNPNIPTFNSGTVVKTGNDSGGLGNYVVVKDKNGFYNYYAHMSKINVKEGQKVKDGDILGVQGQTGNATGPHLHIEVRDKMGTGYRTTDPETYFVSNPADFLGNSDLLEKRVNNQKQQIAEQKKEEKKDSKIGFLFRAGFVAVGIFCIYIAITKGMFGGSGE